MLLAMPGSLRAQGIRGTVEDSAGRPLAEADIIIGDGTLRTRSDELGAFQVARAGSGRVRVRVRLIGYLPLEATIRLLDDGWLDVQVILTRMPQLLDTIRITDTRLCTPNTLEGFECRRRAGDGRGMFRDAGEIRSLRPSAWADMLDGMPGLRREAKETPDGLDWRPMAPPGRCLVQIFNGEDPQFDGHVRRVPVLDLVHRDVVAIEYYRVYADVPENFKRYAWPNGTGEPCALIVYWLRIAPTPARGRGRG